MSVSEPWYAKLFGRAADRRPSDALAEWHFTDSAEVQLRVQPEHAGRSTLTLGVLPMEPEYARLLAVGLSAGPIQERSGYFTLTLHDPDGNRIELASAQLR